MDPQKYPIREAISIARRLKIVVWRDAYFIDMRYDIATKVSDAGDKTEWEVIASFKYHVDFIRYLSAMDIDSFQSI